MAGTANIFHFLALILPVGARGKGFEVLGTHRQRRLGLPREPGGHIVACGFFAGPGHVAGRTGRRAVIHARRPGTASRIEIILGLVGMVNGTVFGLLIDFDLGMIRVQVTLVAGFGHTGFGHRKPMARVARCAGAFAAVQVEPSDAGIGPGVGIDFTFFIDLDHRTVTVKAAGLALIIGVHSLVQPGIQLPHDLDGVGMFAFAVLGGLIRVAAGTVLGGDNRGDWHLVFGFAPGHIRSAIVFLMVLGDVPVTGLYQVAVQTGNIGIGMSTLGPVCKRTGRRDAVAFNTCLGLRRDTALDPIFLDRGKIGLLSHGSNDNQPDTQQTDREIHIFAIKIEFRNRHRLLVGTLI